MQNVWLVLLAVAAALPGCSGDDPQASLERAIQQRDGERVATLLDRGADAFAPRGDRPSLFAEAVFATLEDNLQHGIDSPPNPAYRALCRKWRSQYPPVDATLTLNVGLAFLGLDEGGARVAPVVTSTYNGSTVTIELAHDETDFRNIPAIENGYVIKLPPGPYRINGRLIDDVIEAESIEFLGSEEVMAAAMTIPLRRFLRSTVRLHGTYTAEFVASRASRAPDGGRLPADQP